jgi:hypothetical protein
MNTRKIIPALISLGLIFFEGCDNLILDKPDSPTAAPPPSGHGTVLVSLAGANVLPSPNARTMLPQNPEFTRYGLEFFTDADGNDSSGEQYSLTNSRFQLQLPAGDYYILANGYNGEVLVAQSAKNKEGKIDKVTVSEGSFVEANFVLKPYMAPTVNGVLGFSLSWDSLSNMPDRAELEIKQYGDYDNDSSTDDTAEPIVPSLISGFTQAGPGTILLVDKAAAFINLSGSLSLPAGGYDLKISVTMNQGKPVSRSDIAHVYSNLTTPAVFHYGGGDLLLSNTSPDSGAAFITGFTFAETPNATTVIGSQPGADGTRLIMIMVPEGTELKDNPDTTGNIEGLTPNVECAPGSSIIAPLAPDGTTSYAKGEIDFTAPTIWTAQARNGAIQRYTVVVSNAPVDTDNKKITYFFFKNYADYPGIIDQEAKTIMVRLPYGTTVTSLTPIISIIGYDVVKNGGGAIEAADFSSSKSFDVYATSGHTDSAKTYTVTVELAANTDKEITQFAIDGYPDVPAVINNGTETITATLPYGVSRANLTSLILYKGKKLEPASGAAQNFSAPVYYTVTADNDTQKTYKVTLDNAPPNTDAGIFDFRITNVPLAKVVIGQKPRQDGKIPIVIQVPFGTNEKNLITSITLADSSATISTPSGSPVPFGNENNNQEAVYTVTAQDTVTKKDYAVVVSAGGQYLYVNGATGDDTWPDYYDGQSPDRPFKTLAYAVKKASETNSSINHIFVTGELNADNQQVGGGDSNSVIAINGTGGEKITVTGMGAGATFKGTTNKRVLSVTGGADLVFENITVTGGNVSGNGNGISSGNGGGIYIGGDTSGVYSKVKFSGGGITGNTASGSGGGVYIEGSGAPDANSASEFTLENASISGNTALGASPSDAPLISLAGGGGVCVSGDALFWMSSGTIANNTAGKKTGSTYSGGSGGGVLVRATLFDTNYAGTPANLGFIMSGGTISGNNSYGNSSPHGGGGVYTASGEFDMQGGSITSNYSKRQGGGVFVHSKAVFNASGFSSITGNDGVGSSKGLCSRGVTEMVGNAQADTVYVWNPLAEDGGIDANMFTMAQNARVGGVVLAHSTEKRNFINLANTIDGAGPIANIDLEGHLTPPNYTFVDTNIKDWLDKAILVGADSTLTANIQRFSLGTFVGGTTLSLSPYELKVVDHSPDPKTGDLKKK